MIRQILDTSCFW
ncbi:hypothetical protein IEO21_10925 [Rhodonia placenta]|uniref:Uncharacterized protein n=1 Tax=Rhodonia placenta TaxID=104341 RepID=A0A8H7TVY2_9APHY|nr:hypothetical protein IEO21_10925 [Postia placenta]